MLSYRNFKMVGVLLTLTVLSCTKLNEGLNGTLTNQQTADALGPEGIELLLQTAYTDVGGPFNAQDLVFSLEENSTDESLVPTRGGDWDDNGVWRVIHAHTWNADHSQVLNVYNSLNKLNFDATNVLAFNPSTTQAAQAKFLRALSLYYLLDIYGQYPFRNPGDNLLNAPEVKTGPEAIQFIIDDLNGALPDLPDGGSGKMYLANKDACKTLLMRCYLNRGSFINRAAPTFDASDLTQVINLGNEIINSGHYSYMPEYFDNFSVNNDKSSEGIFAHQNITGTSSGNSGINARWFMTLHYNQYTPDNPNAGWNGFSTIADFYNSFGYPTATTATSDANRINGLFSGVGATTNKDTALDKRLGGRFYPGVTDKSGQRPGFMIGQQYNQDVVRLHDRKWDTTGGKKPDPNTHLLAFDPKIATDMIETGDNLEVTGIRVEKYPSDLSNGKASYDGPSGNDLMIFRYPEVVLMVAEAKLRSGDEAGALTLVNDLRDARGAAPMAALTLVNEANVDDPNTLLAERGRELYWESVRRTDLIRFGVFLKPWQYKPNDDPKNLVFPVPNQALAANPNLIQNPGY